MCTLFAVACRLSVLLQSFVGYAIDTDAVEKGTAELKEIMGNKNCSVQADGSYGEIEDPETNDIACNKCADDTKSQDNIESGLERVDLRRVPRWYVEYWGRVNRRFLDVVERGRERV